MVDDADRWLRTLPRLREVEANATTPAQRSAHSDQSSFRDTFAAARAQGWTGAELARASGYDAGQVNYRAAHANTRWAGHATGLNLPVPARKRPAVANKWLPPQQARQRLGVGRRTLQHWRLHGLLPLSRYRGRSWEYH